MTGSLHPRENSKFVGHAHAEEELLTAWASGRLHHGWLINGPKGIGKATLAYRFARFLLMHEPPSSIKNGPTLFGMEQQGTANPDTLETDPTHPVYRRVAANGHADLKVIERGLSEDGKRMQTIIPVDRIRAIGHSMSLTAGEGGWRVTIIDGAEDMNPNAANALLKILEEPPPRALLLLVSHSPGKLLPTIRSRCRQLKLSTLPPTIVDEFVSEVRSGLSNEDRKILMRLSDGSIGRALQLTDSDGIALQQDLIELMNSMPTMDMVAAHSFADKVTQREADMIWRTAVELFTRNIAELITAGATGRNLKERGYRTEEASCLAHLYTLGRPERWLDAWEKLENLFSKSDITNLNRKQVMLSALTTIENVTQSGV